MSTQYDIMLDIKSAITSNAPLNTWANSNFARAITVLLANRPLKSIRPEQYPVAVVVFEPSGIEERMTGSPMHLTENYHIELGIHDTNPEVSLSLLAEYERLLAIAVLATPTRAGMAWHTTVVGRVADGDVNHPYHFIGLKFQIQRDGPY